MVKFLFTAACLIIFAAIQDVAAHSTQRNPIRKVSVIDEPTLNVPSKRAHYHSSFDLTFTLRDDNQEVRLALEPNHEILHESMHINYLQPDGTLSRSEKIQRHEHKVYRGSTFTRRAGRSEWKKTGWARITLHRDGHYPIFEGAFRINGDTHHVETGYNYRRTKQEADPEPDTREDLGEYMTVWKDSDTIQDRREPNDLKRDVNSKTSCNSDALSFNTDLASVSLRSRGQSSPEMLFGRQVDSGNGQTGWDLRNTIGETAGCPSQRQIALVGIATDCTYSATFNDTQAARSHIITMVNTASEVYESTFNITLGIQNLTISESACPSSSSGSTAWNAACDASTAITDRLNQFSVWRGEQSDNNAFWTLLTTCGSGTSVGIAWMGQVCASGTRSPGNGQNVAGANVVVRTRSEWQVFAHEAGHIFGAVHDCDDQACAGSGTFIMNPSTASDISRFSPCSIGNICSAIRREFVQSDCLTDNRNVETISDSQCGNGIVEVGEECDCGGEEGCGNNSCCDAQTCTYVGNAVCDPSNEACCTDQCQIASQGTVCRASTGSCDPEETCPGDAATCPNDQTLDDGDSCGADGEGLTCASGQCTSRDEQCQSAVASVISSLAVLANAATIDLHKREAPLDVKIEQIGNSEVKATITNTGSVALRVLKTGSILDSAPIEKAVISQGDHKVAFDGVRFYIHTAELHDESFLEIASGETVEVQWDAAQGHDLSAGGNFDIITSGSLQYAEEGSNKIAGQVVYSSNTLQAKVDGIEAATVHTAFHKSQKAKRIAVQSDCSSSQRSTVNSAITAARTLATQAQTAASAGTRLQEHFRSSSSSTRSTVSSVFEKAASLFDSNSSGAAKLHCADVGQWCTDGVVAYAQPGAQEYIVVCPYWFQFPATANACYGPDRPSILIHEATHLVEVKATDDVCYGYDGCVETISASQSLNNADSYAIYANSIRLNC
ncbi:Disintegrin and metalloproteinase domain-containing protein B [Paramyrothecium foliicola]|nr:Disintegrin and metalloproteinase domain-containing protein B [Paramyrothecium foliicola]